MTKATELDKLVGARKEVKDMDLQHPIIAQIEKNGFPNMVAQPEHNGIDYYGTEILTGDTIINLPDGEMLHEDNLEDYLIEVLGFEFTTAI